MSECGLYIEAWGETRLSESYPWVVPLAATAWLDNKAVLLSSHCSFIPMVIDILLRNMTYFNKPFIQQKYNQHQREWIVFLLFRNSKFKKSKISQSGTSKFCTAAFSLARFKIRCWIENIIFEQFEFWKIFASISFYTVYINFFQITLWRIFVSAYASASVYPFVFPLGLAPASSLASASLRTS